jgi:hypothetical protein
MNLSTSLKEILALTFYEIKFTGNIFLLDKDYSFDKNYSEIEIKSIFNTWLQLYSEYFEKTDDIRFRKELIHQDECLRLLLEIKPLESIYQTLTHLEKNKEFVHPDDYTDTIKSLFIKLKNLNKDIEYELSRSAEYNNMKLDGHINLLKSQYETHFKQDLVIEEKDEEFYKEIKNNIYKILGETIHFVNMTQWIFYEKEYMKRNSH